MGETVLELRTNLVGRSAIVEELPRHHGFADTDSASGAMISTEAFEQVAVAFMLFASAIAMELGEQVGVLLRDQVGLVCVALEEAGVEREAAGGGGGIRRGAHVVNAQTRDDKYRENDCADEKASRAF